MESQTFAEKALTDWGFVVAVLGVVYARSDNVFNKINYWQTQLHEDAELGREKAMQLRGHTLGAAYRDSLRRALDWLDRVFGNPGSAQALGVYDLIAVSYAYASFFLGWGSGSNGDV